MIISLLSALFPLAASMSTIEPKGPYSSSLLAKIGVVEATRVQTVSYLNEMYGKIVQPVQALDTSEEPVQKKIENVQVESKGVEIDQVKILASVSAYTSREIETDADPCTSANGKNICDLYAQGTRICAANGYPFGTVLHVDGLGDCVVMDRMAKKYGKDHVDWYFGYDLHGALQWGRQKRLVSVK